MMKIACKLTAFLHAAGGEGDEGWEIKKGGKRPGGGNINEERGSGHFSSRAHVFTPLCYAVNIIDCVTADFRCACYFLSEFSSPAQPAARHKRAHVVNKCPVLDSFEQTTNRKTNVSPSLGVPQLQKSLQNGSSRLHNPRKSLSSDRGPLNGC